MSTLRVGNITATGGTGTITVPTGNQISQVDQPAGLVLITNASFTTATSFSLPNGTFSSSFRNYRVVININTLASDSDFTMRLRTSGTDNTTNGYNTAFLGYTSGGGTSNQASVNSSSFVMGESDSVNILYHLSFDIFNPQQSLRTIFVGQYGYVPKDASAHIMRNGGGQFNDVTSFDSLSFISSAASSMTGVYAVYGYRTA